MCVFKNCIIAKVILHFLIVILVVIKTEVKIKILNVYFKIRLASSISNIATMQSSSLTITLS